MIWIKRRVGGIKNGSLHQVKGGVLAIYTSHPGGNLEHKNRTTKLDMVEDNDPLQSISISAYRKRLKRVEKLHCLKSQPIFSEASQMEWRIPSDFPTRISRFFHVDGKYPLTCKEPPRQGCALAKPRGPLQPTFALGWQDSLSFFILIMLDTLELTG